MQEIMSKKGHEKMTMTKKVIRMLGKNDRMTEVKSKLSRVTELRHFFNPTVHISQEQRKQQQLYKVTTRIFQWIKLVLWNVSNAEYSAAYKT